MCGLWGQLNLDWLAVVTSERSLFRLGRDLVLLLLLIVREGGERQEEVRRRPVRLDDTGALSASETVKKDQCIPRLVSTL